MTRKYKPAQALFARKTLVVAVAVACSSAAMAIEIDSGNEDVKIRWDNTVRYNLGMRMDAQDARILANPSYDESDSKFNKHDIVTNRIDLLSEVDVNYKKRFGARVSGSAWYDKAYDDHSVRSPAGRQTSYFNDQYNAKVSRYVNGPSAEFLDAFVWSNFNLGVVPVNVKLGQHSLYWGEGLLLGAHSVAYSQAPIDGQKAVSSPGIETKEVFLPVNQLSFKAQLTSDLTIAGQYALDWKPTRAPNSGTYLSNGDTTPDIDRLGLTPTFSARNVGAVEPKKRGSNWGLSARLNVEPINSTVGLYHRQFNDYNPGAVEFTSFTRLVPGNVATTVPATFRFNYQPDVKITGVSLARAIGPVSFGSELSLRKNGALVGTGISSLDKQGPRGNTLHAVASGIYLLPKTALWDTGSVIGELAYSRLQSVTANESLYRGVGTANCRNLQTPGVAGSGDKSDGCATKDFLQMAVNFTPQYLGIFPSWDLDLPMTLNYGIRGNAPSVGGGAEGVLSWSVGAKMTYQVKHEFSLRYSDVRAPAKYNVAGNTLIGGTGSAASGTDRAWLVFTYKTSF
ncbi:DUF1302 family protein [Polaromonas sp.]|uniref:DUF1302 domain-containing protein n=1 Tax=Polaromonas sp. TaxID=1869339 RepID=UPI001D5FD7BE|nr:DUF1302 family protein [Polaromonas sp.]MBT9475188.1 DUF1302 family protein [Polaromonas sp.]